VRNSLLVLFLFLLSFSLKAQTNLYNQLSIPATFYPNPGVQEYKGNYYAVSFNVKDSVFYGDYPYLYPLEYSIHKFSVSSHALLASTVISGDTLQADSTLQFMQPLIEVQADRVHLTYLKRILHDTITQPSYKQFWWELYYKQLDTNLNVTVPETRIELADNSTQLSGIYLQNLNVSANKVTIAFHQSDTSMLLSSVSRYIQLDFAGNLIRKDTLGIPMLAVSNPSHQVAEINNYPGNKYLISGQSLYTIPNAVNGMFYLADSAMNMLDTFALKPFLFYNAPDVSGYFSRFPNLLALPTGSIIGGGEYRSAPSGQNYTALVKCTAASRYSIDKFITFKNVDQSDGGHKSSPSIHNLTYNPNDNLIYYADVTHTTSFGCLANENYVEVLCLDTNLHIKWQKYILAKTNSCSWVGYVEGCSERPGVLISGGSYDSPPTTFLATYHPFIFHLDSAIVAGISNTPSATVRDRVQVFPNPAHDYITIDDILHENGEVCIYDMQGSLKYRNSYGRSKAKVLLSEYPAGMYFIRVTTQNNQIFSFKILKE
jgi:hypothetical protein